MKNKDINFLNNIKESCTICNGLGYSIIEKDSHMLFADCECVKTILYKGNLLNSGIPARYIDWDISKLNKDFLENNKESGAYDYIINYIDNIKQNIEDGISFWMASPPGLAKSSISAYIIKQAITCGYKGCYCTMAKLVSQKFKDMDDDEEGFINEVVYKADIIVIEEFEKVYLKEESSFINHKYYEILSDFYDNKKSIILTSNKTKKEVYKTLPSYIIDRLETIDYIPICGKSGRI